MTEQWGHPIYLRAKFCFNFFGNNNNNYHKNNDDDDDDDDDDDEKLRGYEQSKASKAVSDPVYFV